MAAWQTPLRQSLCETTYARRKMKREIIFAYVAVYHLTLKLDGGRFTSARGRTRSHLDFARAWLDYANLDLFSSDNSPARNAVILLCALSQI